MITDRRKSIAFAIALSIAVVSAVLALTTTTSACDVFLNCTDPPDSHKGASLTDCYSDSDSDSDFDREYTDCCEYSEANSDCTYTLCRFGCNDNYEEFHRSRSCYINDALPEAGNRFPFTFGIPFRGSHRAGDQIWFPRRGPVGRATSEAVTTASMP